MSDLSWLKDFSAFATAAAALVVALLTMLGTYLSNKHKARLDLEARRESVAADDIKKQKLEEVDELRKAIGLIQQMRNAIGKLIANASVAGAHLSANALQDLEKGTQAIESAYEPLIARYPKDEIIHLHTAMNAARTTCRDVRAIVGKQKFVPKLSDAERRELELTREQMSECQNQLRDSFQAILFNVVKRGP